MKPIRDSLPESPFRYYGGMNRERLHKPLHPALVVGFWVLAALALRLFLITRESLWWDEYASHVYLNAPSLLDFLRLNRTLDPLTLPVYYVFEYLWTHYVYDSVISLRLMSIGIGLATLPLVYVMGKRLYGVRAGYVAVALMAVSPVHIHHSQGIRMYVVFIFLAAALMWSFLRLLERSSMRSWLLHGFVSLLLYWTHPFACLAPAVIGAFLLINCRRRFGLFWRWTCLQIVLFLPTVVYLSSVRFWPTDSTSKWIESPSLASLGADLFFDDISAFHWQFRLGDFAQRLGAGRMALDVAFAALIGMLLLYSGVRYVWRSKDLAMDGARDPHLLLVIWLLLPPLLLFVLSWIVRPCMFPRYTVHCSIPLYLLLGGAVTSLSRKRLSMALGALLVAGMFLQWLWLQPGPQRTDWRSAGLFLRERAVDGDVVVVESFLWRDVFVHNLKYMAGGALPLPVAAAEKRPLLAAQAVLCAGMLPEYDPSGRKPHIWAVIAMDYFDSGVPVEFEHVLQRFEMPFERWVFPAVRSVFVYRIDALQTPQVRTMADLFAQWEKVSGEAEPENGDLDHNVMQAFGDLAVELALYGHSKMALDILDGVFSKSSFAKQIYGNLYQAIETGGDIISRAAAIKYLWDGYGFRENGQPAYAREAFEKAVALDPDHATANLELGFEYCQLGEYQKAVEVLDRAVRQDGRYNVARNLVEALHSGRDVEKTFEAVQAYRQGILEQSRGRYAEAATWLRKAAATDPRLDDAHTSLVFVLIIERKLDEAQRALDNYLKSDDTPSPGAFGLQAAIYIARGEPDKALEYADKAFSADAGYAREFGPFFNALLREKNLAKTLAEMDRLKARGTDLYPLLYENVLNLLH